jgi:hypothetical protein
VSEQSLGGSGEPSSGQDNDREPATSGSATPATAAAVASAADTADGTLSPAVYAFFARTFPQRLNSLPNDAVLLLGITLVLAAVDPTKLAMRGPVGWLFAMAAMAAAIWAAPVVSRRPTAESIRFTSQLSRHRNTVFAVGCTILAGFSDPPVWLMVIDAALLLAYLLAVDALAAGPVGIRQLRHGMAPLCAAAAVAMVLLAAQAPVNSGAVWGRIVAALAVAAAATAAGAALWIRQTGKQSAQTGLEEPPAHSPHR